MNTIRIAAAKPYDVLIGTDLLKDIGAHIVALKNAAAAMVVSDDVVFNLYGEGVVNSLMNQNFKVHQFVFKHGEKSKNMQTYEALCEHLCQSKMTKNDVIIALGGGVVGDLAGFAAATYLRGIRYVQVPTTLLAAVDSSVGGKTAIDLNGGKNQVGCFYQPALVLCDLATQKTLPDEQLKCGLAEVIKYAVIGDEDLFTLLETKPAFEYTEQIVTTCVKLKNRFVKKDEFDQNERMLLNFGHTFGHAAEACSNFKMLHGMGVAAGMATMAKSAQNYGICDAAVPQKITALLQRYGLPTEIHFPLEKMVNAALNDKKNVGQNIHLIVPEKIGHCRIETVPAKELSARMQAGGIV